MRVHELRKALAWYSRGLWGGAQLRQNSGGTNDVAALLDLGEAFFSHLAGSEQGDPDAPASLFTTPADPVAKSIARNVRRGGSDQVEAEEPVAPSSMDAAS